MENPSLNFVEEDLNDKLKPILDFPVIAVGASAGGLEAVTDMFHDVPDDTGMSFVLVLHLDPNHESLMAELLSRKTQLDVRQVKNGDTLAIDPIHVIPPGLSLEMEGAKLKLVEFSEPRGLRRPIDNFFKSLAAVQGDRAASVILSGTGADGSFGMRAIKETGGICVVQLPKEARYDGMPLSAVATDLVDFVLPSQKIVERVKLYFEGVFRPEFPSDSNDFEKTMLEIFGILKSETGHDFSGYKRSTLFRRLERRLQVLECTEVSDYISMLQESDVERNTLFQDFLIHVTSFFRDDTNFETLRNKVIFPLIKNALPSDELRIWVPGCASGQEAYSIAMIVDDVCEQLHRRPFFQIFGTDIDSNMIEYARRGQYPATTFKELPEKFQLTYTVAQDNQFEIVRRVRDMVRFSVHNLVNHAPFSKLDLISCRNLLIYFGEDLQRQILPLFHFSLREGGHLFLGNSESAVRREELFSPVDQTARIYKRVETGKRTALRLPIGAMDVASHQSDTKQISMSKERDFPRHARLDSSNLIVYEQYAPPFIRVAQDGRIIDSSGDLSLFLMSRPSDEGHIFSLAREGLREVVTPLLNDAVSANKRVALKDIEISSPFGTQTTHLIAHPMKDQTVALVFITKDRLAPQIDEFAVLPPTRDQRLSDLQDDLQSSRLLLKTKVEEIETANEELKSSNEEMMSMNEELQSANEELTTANEELKNKIDEVLVANADLDNFMQSTELVMVVLDRAFRIRHLTEAAKEFFPLQESDRGRPITEFMIHLEGVNLAQAVRKVLETSKPFEQDTVSEDGERAFVLRIKPYFFVDGSIEGTTITLVDVTEVMVLRQRPKRATLEHRDMLIKEMSHRVKNLFAVISSLVQLAPKKSDETKEFSQSLISRIGALGETYDLTRMQDNITGVSIQELLKQVLKPHCTSQELTLNGTENFIPVEQLTTVTLIFHELATNAIKYGALSKKKGKLDISWEIDDDSRLKIVWQETTPKFNSEIAQSGFGSRLIEMGARQLNATFTRSFGENGLTFELQF